MAGGWDEVGDGGTIETACVLPLPASLPCHPPSPLDSGQPGFASLPLPAVAILFPRLGALVFV